VKNSVGNNVHEASHAVPLFFKFLQTLFLRSFSYVVEMPDNEDGHVTIILLSYSGVHFS